MWFIYFVSVNEYFILEGQWSHQPLVPGSWKTKEYSQTAGSSYLCPTLCIKPNYFSGRLSWWFKWLENWYMRDAVWFLYVFIHLTTTYWVPTLSPKSKGLCITERVQVRGDCSQTLTHLEFIVLEVNHGSTQHSLWQAVRLGTTTNLVQTDSKVCWAGPWGRDEDLRKEKLGRGQAVNTVWFRQCPPCVWRIALQMLFYLISITDRYYSNPTLAHQASTFNSSQGQEAWKTEAIAAGSRTGHEKTSQRKM